MATQKKAAGKAAPAKKTTAAKKPAAAAKKPAARKKPAAAKNPTAKEIVALMEKMSDDALAMLKRQAEVLAYAEELEAARSKMKEAVDKGLEERAVAEQPTEETYIDQSGPASFFIGARGKRVFFSREELRNLTRLSHGAEDALAGARRIFTWLERERQDFLNDTGISQPGDRSLQRLWEIIVTTYKAP